MLHSGANIYKKERYSMNSKKSIPLEQFTVHIPNPTNRLTAKTIVIHENGRFSMNSRLAQELGGKKVAVSFTTDAKHLLLRESNDVELIYFPKSGSKKLDRPSSFLKELKISLPTTYEVWLREDDGYWQGDLVANPTMSPSKRRRSSKKS